MLYGTLFLSVASAALLTATAAAAPFRAAWVASVYNLNFPSRAGLPAETQRGQIRAIVAGAERAGLNALLVQVRPEGDALYESHLEPWSRYLTGVQGGDPGYDPLAEFIREGARHGIAIHAWINPYRAAANAGAPRSPLHETSRLSSSVRRVGGALWLDPGDAAVRLHLTQVVRDLIRKYELAGVVLDDYFYPYPGKGYARGSFPDRVTYARYQTGGGGLSLDAWRRQNVDDLIEGLRAAVKSVRPNALFGVSPFGIYTHGQPADVTADLDQYHDLYADPVKWLKEGWVDYLSPQLYWRDGSAQSYSSLLRWWRSPEVNPHGVPIYPSIALERLGPGYGWPAAEIERQLRLEQTIGPRAAGGFVLWNVGPLLQNQKGVATIVAGTRG